MRKTLIATALAGIFALPMVAAAEEAAAPSPLTGNMTIASDYRFRGISQTWKQPALQGGIDYAHSSGFYAGNWNSNVSGNSYLNGNLEMDFYAGFKFPVAGSITMDVGALYYYYPAAKYNAAGDKYDNQELYVGASWEWLSVKYSYGISDFFGLKTATAVAGTGTGDSKGSTYLDVSVAYPLSEKLTLVAHVGQQKVKNYGDYGYTDYKLGLNYDLGGWILGAAYINTNAKDAVYKYANTANTETKSLGDSTVVLSVSKTF